MLELCRCPNIYGPDCISHCASSFWIFYYENLTYCAFKVNGLREVNDAKNTQESISSSKHSEIGKKYRSFFFLLT